MKGVLNLILAATFVAYGTVASGQTSRSDSDRLSDSLVTPDARNGPNAHGQLHLPSPPPQSYVPSRSPDLGSPTFPLSPSIGPGSGLLGPESGPGPARLRSGHESGSRGRNSDPLTR